MKKFRILTTKTDPEVNVRLPQELHDTLGQLAESKGRSLNTQLVISLIDSMEALEQAQKAAANRNYSGEELMRMIMNGSGSDFKPVRQKQ